MTLRHMARAGVEATSGPHLTSRQCATRADVSILIVSWNCKQLLAACLDSLRGQLPNHATQIVVVDNASSDGTSEHIQAHYPEVEFIGSGSNLGFARGNNLGLASCEGEYICLINPDVIVQDECLAKMLRFMEDHPEVGMMGPQILGLDGAIQRSCMREPTLWNQFCRALALDSLFAHSRMFGGYLMNDFEHATRREVEVLNGCFWVIRREALAQAGYLDERFWMYSEDLDWCHRFRDAGMQIVFYPEAKAVHCGGGSSRNAPLSSFTQMQHANLLYWRKYHGTLSSLCYWGILCIGHLLRCAILSLLYLVGSSQRSDVRYRLSRHVAAARRLLSSDFVGTL